MGYLLLQCHGVTTVHTDTTGWCCLISKQPLLFRKPGNVILYYKDNTPVQCQNGWAGDECEACAPRFEPPGECSRCSTGWSGDNCNTCAQGWTGDNCDACANNFGPTGVCDTCVGGWRGDSCDDCGFGFSRESNCTDCIQNGRWDGFVNDNTPLRVHLTFNGRTCSDITPGKYILCLPPQTRLFLSGTLILSMHYTNYVERNHVAM